MPLTAENHVIGGLKVRLYRNTRSPAGPIALTFLLHGRQGSSEDVTKFAETVIMEAERQERGIYVVTLVPIETSNQITTMMTHST